MKLSQLVYRKDICIRLAGKVLTPETMPQELGERFWDGSRLAIKTEDGLLTVTSADASKPVRELRGSYSYDSHVY